jgi:RNA recognition motif-containing protein
MFGSDDPMPLASRNTIVVRNLNATTVSESLATAFEQFGEIDSVRIVQRPGNPADQGSAGFAFIEFKAVESANKAVDSGQEITVDGNQVTVRAARAPPVRRSRRRASLSVTSDQIRDIFDRGHLQEHGIQERDRRAVDLDATEGRSSPIEYDSVGP